MVTEKNQNLSLTQNGEKDPRTVNQNLPDVFRVIYFRNMRAELLCKAAKASSEGRALDAWCYRHEASNFTF